MGSKEHDFLGMANPHPPSRLHRRHSFRDISKINPEIVKSVMASAAAMATDNPPPLPVYHHFPLSRETKVELEDGKDTETGPMTIIYNGTVSVFDLPNDKVESILKFAMEKTRCMDENDKQHVGDDGGGLHSSIILESINDGVVRMLGMEDADLPMKRKKSLQRFFEKRKERLISGSPYECPTKQQQHHQKSVA